MTAGFDAKNPSRSRRGARQIGWTDGPVATRVDQHLAGRGSPRIKAGLAAGCTVTLARTWSDVDRHFERRLKNQHEAPRMCPQCVATGAVNGRPKLGAVCGVNQPAVPAVAA